MCAVHFGAAVGLVLFVTCVTRRVEVVWLKDTFLHGRGQLQFSDNEGRQRIYTFCSYSSEPNCTTDQALKQCHQQKVEKCNRLSSGPCPRAINKSNHVSKSTRLSSGKAHESLGDEAKARAGTQDWFWKCFQRCTGRSP